MSALRFQLFCFVCAASSISIAERSWSQELEKVRADYFSGPIQYSPEDPWTRSKVFQTHTGHSGFFYNCDDEECKRHSPYINWTANCEPQWPLRRGLINGIRIDLDKVRRRINSGSCGCNDCADCQNQTCSCQDSIAERPKQSGTVRVALKDE